MQQDKTTIFFDKLQTAFHEGNLVKITLSKLRDKENDLQKIIISPVKLKAGVRLSFVYRYKTRDITKNFLPDEAVHFIEQSLEFDFLNADMYIVGENVKLLIDKKDTARLLTQKIDLPKPVSLNHNRIKERAIVTQDNIWLREVGITNASWQVKHEMKDKYLQINRYIELLQPEIDRLEKKDKFTVVDMGSGKGYLTFALYQHLTNSSYENVNMKGVEYRPDLVDICNRIAVKAGFENLEFLQGTIENTQFADPDILIALHACDTATDDAIYRGISQNASLIVCAPCCHKQIRKAMKVENEFSSVLKHGILEERQAELLTDGLRALLMEVSGYKTRVFEFISSEHTSKNIMIVGRKVGINEARKAKLLDEIAAVKRFFGIDRHYLEDLLSI
jgi:SAM-dependent methyltransferase